MGWSPTQQKVIAILPKFSSVASLCGSSCIIAEVLLIDRRKLKRVYHRLLLAMSVYDVMESCWNFASTWPIPRHSTASTVNNNNDGDSSGSGVAFAVGTTRSCTAQGFFLQLGLAIPILNMCLSCYYLLVIKHSWSEDKIRKRAEPFFHIGAFVVAFSTAVACVALDLFNNANLWCWIAPLPWDCTDSYTYHHDIEQQQQQQPDCIRGDNAWIYRWAFYYAELWFCLLFVMGAMIAVYLQVRKLENSTRLYNPDAWNNTNTTTNITTTTATASTSDTTTTTTTHSRYPSKSRRVAIQALYYVGAFYMTFVFSTINRIVQQTTGNTHFSITVLHTIFDPLQGFLNYSVYIRPRFVKYREKNPSVYWFLALKRIIFPDEDTFRTRCRESEYVDDDHRDEEEARQELGRWRLLQHDGARENYQARNYSGLFRLISLRRLSINNSSSRRLSVTNDDELQSDVGPFHAAGGSGMGGGDDGNSKRDTAKGEQTQLGIQLEHDDNDDDGDGERMTRQSKRPSVTFNDDIIGDLTQECDFQGQVASRLSVMTRTKTPFASVCRGSLSAISERSRETDDSKSYHDDCLDSFSL